MLNFNNDPFLKPDPNSASERRLLLGIDAPLTAATSHALHAVGTLFAPYITHVHILLLHVIPVPYTGGRYAALRPFPPTAHQRELATEALRTTCAAFLEYGMIRSHIDMLIRVGSPVDELVRVATQQHVDCLVIGSRGHAPLQQLRRVFMGSLSRGVLHQASCPVMAATLPQPTHPGNLVAWYEATVQQTLHDHPTALVNITASDVLVRFPPAHVRTAGRKEQTAAAQALENLAGSGVLYRHVVNGEVHYLND
jgi:nucleotide-binding universal stress UspA family protein